jgi:hypothetical protein
MHACARVHAARAHQVELREEAQLVDAALQVGVEARVQHHGREGDQQAHYDLRGGAWADHGHDAREQEFAHQLEHLPIIALRLVRLK